MTDIPILAQSDYQESAGRRLRHLIDLLGITQVKAAEIMGVSKHVLRNWIAGENPISPYALYRLHKVKGVDFNYVFLDDWARLPHNLAVKLEAELQSQLAAALEQARQDA